MSRKSQFYLKSCAGKVNFYDTLNLFFIRGREPLQPKCHLKENISNGSVTDPLWSSYCLSVRSSGAVRFAARDSDGNQPIIALETSTAIQQVQLASLLFMSFFLLFS